VNVALAALRAEIDQLAKSFIGGRGVLYGKALGFFFRTLKRSDKRSSWIVFSDPAWPVFWTQFSVAC
jgi:hypothetical protein